MMKLGLSHHLPLETVSDLLEDIEIVYPKELLASYTPKELHHILPELDGFICIADTPFTKEEFEKAPHLSFLGNLGSGFNNIDVEEATRRGIPVLNTPFSVVQPTAENTLSLMLDITRGTARYDRNLRKTGICPKELLNYTDMTLAGKILGIVGYGRIGRQVGVLAQAFGMHIIHHDPYSPESVPLEELLAKADVVSLHVPYSKENHHLINSQTLSCMKPSAYLLNVSRGAIVEETALVEALRNKKIKGAALDVHEFEPTVSEAIRSLDTIVITPHISTNLAESRLQMLRELVEGLHTMITEHTFPKNTVNAAGLQKKELS